MKIALVHNYYQQPGGEDVVLDQEATLLRDAGHEVTVYSRSNDEIRDFTLLQKLGLPKKLVWASDTVRDVRKLLRTKKPDVVHFHNTFALISPAAYYACQEANVPVVQSLHNQRLMCPSANFYRNEAVCEDCLGKSLPWPGIVHACYRNSHTRTAAVAAMVSAHRWFKTWENQVDRYIVFTQFYRKKFIEGGLPADKIVVKPHFIHPDPGLRNTEPGGYALFVGRLDAEKGVRTMLRAWQGAKEIPLKVRGDGDLLQEVNDAASHNHLQIDVIGRIPRNELITLIKGARFLVWPSEGYYENFGLVAVEAFACGVPVIASRTGVMAEIIKDQRTGLHFRPGDPQDLLAKVKAAWADPTALVRMGREARAEFEGNYTAERNYKMLMSIYEAAIERMTPNGKVSSPR